MSTLKTKYKEEVQKQLLTELGLKNIHEVPKITKVVVNSGLGQAASDSRILEMMKEDLKLITGQKPAVALSKKDISNFNRLRKGTAIGLYVTLRNQYMWDMLEKLIIAVLPSLRDFRGISKKSFDSSGNYSIGLKQHTSFFEVDPNKLDHAKGLQLTIVTNTSNRDHSYKLLKSLGFPFRD